MMSSASSLIASIFIKRKYTAFNFLIMYNPNSSSITTRFEDYEVPHYDLEGVQLEILEY